MAIKWLLTKHLRVRYGDVSRMSIRRMVRQGRPPKPEFPLGNDKPAWREDVLDAHDAAAAAAAAAAKRLRSRLAPKAASESVAEITPTRAKAVISANEAA
jgi:hypothetical protein